MEIARKLGSDETSETFERAVNKILPRKRLPISKWPTHGDRSSGDEP